jgi:toluene monooxygenase system ferredoxin subunit
VTYVRVTSRDELRSGDMEGIRVDGHRVLLVCVDQCVYAWEDKCAHLGMPLSQGTLEGTTLTCSAHHFQYDVTSGRGVNPKNVCLRAYPVKVEGGGVYVNLGERAKG